VDNRFPRPPLPPHFLEFRIRGESPTGGRDERGAQFLYSLFISPLFLYSLIICSLLLLSSCSPALEAPWTARDLRLLDPLDAPDPALDLIAVYTRSEGLEDHIRLDFLDAPETPAADVFIALDTKPGGTDVAHLSRLDLEALYPEGIVETDITYDLLLVIPAEGEPGVIDVAESTLSTRLNPRIVRDPALDTLTVIFNRFDLPADYSLQVFVTPAAEHAPADQSAAVSSDAHPEQRANLLMAFSDAFDAATPAQTLRRWDGAHTGPYGERHGLHPLLDAAAAARIPLLLLDLKTPASLSALDLTGGLDQIKRMVGNRLLILPDVVYGVPEEESLSRSLLAAQAFDLPTGKFLFSPVSVGSGYTMQFFNDPQAASPLTVLDWQGQKMLGLPSATEEQTAPDGLTLEARRALVNALFDSGIVVFGGNLPDSSWGDSDAGPAGMRYIAAHPWIQPLDAEALLSLPTVTAASDPLPAPDSSIPIDIYNSQGQATSYDSVALKNEILSRLESAPDNPLTDSAWEMFFLLTASVDDPRLAALNAQYLGDILTLLTAADWAKAPAAQSTCSVDLNADRLPDCVLANNQYFAVFESDGGRLSYLFSHDGRTVHQLVAPGWQFTTGLSDRTEWQPEFGHAADPSQIPGAFFDSESPWLNYTPTLNDDGSVTFSSAEGQTKTYRLVEDGVQLEVSGAPVMFRSGLALDPWRRFEPGWGDEYHAQIESDSLTWRLDGGPSVSIQASGGNMFAFNDTLDNLGKLEDPNQEFPLGHFLPLPMALLEFQAGNEIVFHLVVK
jgi:hypothetical protein